MLPPVEQVALLRRAQSHCFTGEEMDVLVVTEAICDRARSKAQVFRLLFSISTTGYVRTKIIVAELKQYKWKHRKGHLMEGRDLSPRLVNLI